jgi:sugar phosphate isomerase/epimerase
MEIGVCTDVGSAGLLVGKGVDFIEEHVQRFLVPERREAEFAPAKELASASAPPVKAANCFLPGSLRCTGPDADHGAVVAYAEVAFARAREVGIDAVVFGSGGARRLPAGFPKDEATRQFTDLLARLGPLARANGVTVVVEPLNSAECNFINSLAEGAEVVKGASHVGIRLLADFYHMLRDGEPAHEVERHGELIAHCHVAEKEGRACPGTAREDFVPHFSALRAAGYDGRISIECRWDDMAGQVRGGVEYLRRQLAEAGG